jgi:hypothetical protein
MDFLPIFFGLFFQLIPIAVIVLIVVWLVKRNKSKPRRTSRTRLTNPAKKEDVSMKEMMVEKMNDELEQAVHTDTIVIIVGIVLNVVLLGANTGVGAAAHEPQAGLAIKLIFFVLTAFLIVLNVSVGYALSHGKKRRVKITERLDKFWRDEGLEKYQDASIGGGYATRGNLFTFILMALGVVALLISFIAYFVGF